EKAADISFLQSFLSSTGGVFAFVLLKPAKPCFSQRGSRTPWTAQSCPQFHIGQRCPSSVSRLRPFTGHDGSDISLKSLQVILILRSGLPAFHVSFPGLLG